MITASVLALGLGVAGAASADDAGAAPLSKTVATKGATATSTTSASSVDSSKSGNQANNNTKDSNNTKTITKTDTDTKTITKTDTNTDTKTITKTDTKTVDSYNTDTTTDTKTNTNSHNRNDTKTVDSYNTDTDSHAITVSFAGPISLQALTATVTGNTVDQSGKHNAGNMATGAASLNAGAGVFSGVQTVSLNTGFGSSNQAATSISATGAVSFTH